MIYKNILIYKRGFNLPLKYYVTFVIGIFKLIFNNKILYLYFFSYSIKNYIYLSLIVFL